MEEKNNLPNLFSFSMHPIDNTPNFSASEGRQEWVLYGDDNLYPQYLLHLLNNSSKHNAIVKRKTDLVAGGGWNVDDEFIKNENNVETLNDIVIKNSYDLNLYGSFALAITWSKDRKSIARIKYIDPSKIRIAKEIEDDDKDPDRFQRQEDGVPFYFVSGDWTQTRKAKYKPELVQGFSEKWSDVPTQIIYVKEYRPQCEFYALPDYIASVNWIELDYEISNFHLQSVHQGFTPSMIINFNQGVPTEEEQRRLYKKIQAKYAGSDNGSKVFITFSEGGDSKPDFIPITLNDSDERFLMLEEHIMANLTMGHRIPSIIAGVSVEGKLGSTDEIIEQELLFQNQVISAKQELIERTYSMLQQINDPSAADLELNRTTTFTEEVIAPEVPENAPDDNPIEE